MVYRLYTCIVSVILTLLSVPTMSQSTDYYYQIPATPDTYSAAGVAARLVDGLGFRYYWATEGLTAADLSYQPGPESRTSIETLRHIDNLVNVTLKSVQKQPAIGNDNSKDSYEVLRDRTLSNLEFISKLLKETNDAGLTDLKIVFPTGDTAVEYPFWNLINGPISDAIWHVGQVVTFRRSSGNPLNSKASMLQGKVRE